MTILAQPFHEYHFACENPGELPFTEPIGLRGRLTTFASQFLNHTDVDDGLEKDLSFLDSLELSYCAYGACDCEVYPFICETRRQVSLASDVIAALKAKNFRSEHIPTLEETSIPFPGYKPGTDNDEIHNDPTQQFIFPRTEEVDDNPKAAASHDALIHYVVGGHIWYVLLHIDPDPGYGFSHWVNLFAVGRSPFGNRLLGVATHQACHNLCD